MDRQRATEQARRHIFSYAGVFRMLFHDLPDALPAEGFPVPADEKDKYYKTLSFIADFDQSLEKIVASMKDDAFYIWTIGNRFVGNREIPNDKVLIELMESREIELFERAERQILNKKQSKRNNYSKTMEKEHILIFHKSV